MHRSTRGAGRARVRTWIWLLAVGSAACGNVTAGGFAEVAVAVSGDATQSAPAPAPPTTGGPQASLLFLSPFPAAGENDPEGEIEVDFTLALVAASGGVVALGTDDLRVKVDLEGVNEAEVVRAMVPADRYSALRISFTKIHVDVSRGLVIGGQEIVGSVEVELEGDLVVSRPLDLTATEGATVEMLVDLNTPAWLEALDPETLTVDPAVFANLIAVAVR